MFFADHGVCPTGVDDGHSDVLAAYFLFGQIFFVHGTIQLAHGRSADE